MSPAELRDLGYLTADDAKELQSLRLTGVNQAILSIAGTISWKLPKSVSAAKAEISAEQRAVVEGAESAANMANGARLNDQLAAEEIANGHAFEKHVIQQKEFGNSISTPQEFAKIIEDTLNNPSAMKQLGNGRSAYWNDSLGMVVIRNPNASDGGTAFKPTTGKVYYDGL
jgi:filamentous hemagglutinin